jgi:hypothetical protein
VENAKRLHSGTFSAQPITRAVFARQPLIFFVTLGAVEWAIVYHGVASAIASVTWYVGATPAARKSRGVDGRAFTRLQKFSVSR